MPLLPVAYGQRPRLRDGFGAAPSPRGAWNSRSRTRADDRLHESLVRRKVRCGSRKALVYPWGTWSLAGAAGKRAGAAGHGCASSSCCVARIAKLIPAPKNRMIAAQQISLSRALVVEDDEPGQRRLCGLLGAIVGEGLVASVVGSVGEAQAAARAETFDIALVDIGLPDGNGVEFIAWVRKWHPEISCLVITSWGDGDTVLAALRAVPSVTCSRIAMMRSCLARCKTSSRAAPRSIHSSHGAS